MKPVVRLGIGAVLCAAGLIFIMGAQRSLVKDAECVDCEDEEIEEAEPVETDND